MISEKILKPMNGIFLLIVVILFPFVTIPAFVFALLYLGENALIIISFIALNILWIITMAGFKLVNPNQARVFTLFGKYYGTIYKDGFYFMNPFISEAFSEGIKNDEMKKANPNAIIISPKKVSTKVQSFVNSKQKVNDLLGNPIEISAVVIWKVTNATKAIFDVDHYIKFLSDQTDSIIRNISCLYPYDIIEGNEEGVITLKSNATEIAAKMQEQLASRVEVAGLEIMEVRLNQIAYSSEIAAAMLQKQQAVAIIAARTQIVEGAVSMVKLALDQLKEDGIVELDEERKAQMVSNLLVVLCGSKEASPIVNTGTIY